MNGSVGWMHQCDKGYLEGPPKEFTAENMSSKIPITVLYRSQGINSPAGFLPRLTQVTLTIFPNITRCLLLGTAWCQPSSAPVTIREHVSSASMVHKCESQEVIQAILHVALSLSNVLSGETFSIVSDFKLRWTQCFFSLFLGRLEIKISNPTVKITNLL